MVFFSLSPIGSVFIAQPAGVPEILKKSLHSCSVKGGNEVFIIGKNFLKGTKVIFQENASGILTCYMLHALPAQHLHCLTSPYLIVADDKSWKAEADIDMEFFHQVSHSICCVYYLTVWDDQALQK